MTRSQQARAELTRIIMSPEGFDDGPASCGPNEVYAARTADAVLAAGYRKPRTITTTEELDALPVGSVVLRNGRAFQRFAPHRVNAFYEYKAWQCTDGGFVRSTKDGSSILPATVLHEAAQ